MTVRPMTRQKVIEMIDQLPADRLLEVAQFVEFLRYKSTQTNVVPPSEAVLLAVVNRGLPPADQTRVSQLRDKQQSGRLTEAEHTELLAYVDRVEREDAERAEALVELARLRGISLEALLSQLNFEPAHAG